MTLITAAESMGEWSSTVPTQDHAEAPSFSGSIFSAQDNWSLSPVAEAGSNAFASLIPEHDSWSTLSTKLMGFAGITAAIPQYSAPVGAGISDWLLGEATPWAARGASVALATMAKFAPNPVLRMGLSAAAAALIPSASPLNPEGSGSSSALGQMSAAPQAIRSTGGSMVPERNPRDMLYGNPVWAHGGSSSTVSQLPPQLDWREGIHSFPGVEASRATDSIYRNEDFTDALALKKQTRQDILNWGVGKPQSGTAPGTWSNLDGVDPQHRPFTLPNGAFGAPVTWDSGQYEVEIKVAKDAPNAGHTRDTLNDMADPLSWNGALPIHQKTLPNGDLKARLSGWDFGQLTAEHPDYLPGSPLAVVGGRTLPSTADIDPTHPLSLPTAISTGAAKSGTAPDVLMIPDKIMKDGFLNPRLYTFGDTLNDGIAVPEKVLEIRDMPDASGGFSKVWHQLWPK